MPHEDKHIDSTEEQVIFMTPNSLLTELSKHPSFSQLFLTDIGYYPNTKEHYHYNPKPNDDDFHTLVYNIKGSGYSHVGADEYAIDEDHFMIIPKGMSHAYGSISGWSIYWVHFTGTQSNELISEFNITYGKPYAIYSKQSELTSLFHDIFSTLLMGFTLQNAAYASMTLWHIIGSFLFRDRILSDNKEPDPIGESIKYMKDNLHKDISLEEASDIAGYSPSYFTTIFKEQTGTAPITYFINLKMHLASEYLYQTNKTVKEISYLLGYSNQYYFSRLFKIHIGVSPSQYRTTRSKTD